MRGSHSLIECVLRLEWAGDFWFNWSMWRLFCIVLVTGLTGTLEAQTWKVIQTKKGKEIRRPTLLRATDTGIWVIYGQSQEQVFLDGVDMPDWLVEEVKPLVFEERRKAAERIAAAAKGEYQDPNDKRKLPWGDGKGKLVVKGREYQVTSLMEESPMGIKVLHSGGVATLLFADMDEATRESFGFDPELAKRWETLDEKAKKVESAAWFERRKEMAKSK